MKAFLGMGLLGSNFVKAMIKKNARVKVWNRTYARAAALAADGAQPFENLSDAVKDADIIHLTLKDDASVDEVLEVAAAALKPGVTIIDHTTTSVEGAIARTASWKDKGYSYQHAPVFMGPVNALDSSGYMLVSGDQDTIHRLESQLSAMTGKLINFGNETGRAAAMKLTGNCFLVGFTAALGDALALAKSMDVPADEVEKLFAAWNPVSTLSGRIRRITSDDFSQPSWELNMARKDTGLFLKEAQRTNTRLAVIPAIADLMDAWIDKGSGNNDWMIITRGRPDKGR